MLKHLAFTLPFIALVSCNQTGNTTLEIVAGETDTTLFSAPFGICSDNNGNIYVADAGHNQIRVVSPDGEVKVFAGNGDSGSEDGSLQMASFNYPSGICTDQNGNLYVAGFGGQNIRKISPEGVVTTIAGTGEEGYVDGEGSVAQFSSPRGICIDSKGNLFVGDCWNHRIRKITPDGTVSTFAGGGKRGELVVNDWRDGSDTAARFDAPCGMAIDSDDNIYVADANNNCIRKITPQGKVTTLAGIAGKRESRDGPYDESMLNCPTELIVDKDGTVYFSDTYGNQVKRISRDGFVSAIAGSGEPGRINGEPLASTLSSPRGIAISGKYLYFIEFDNRMIRRIKLGS